MSGCDLCLAVRDPSAKLFEDPHGVVILHPHGATPGHLLVVPRIHYSIMEQVPDEELRHLFRVTKLMTESLEKGLATKELNVVITNGPAAGQEFPHFSMHIIPRGQGDNVKITWEPVGVKKEDMDNVEAKLKEVTSQFQVEKKKKEAIVEQEPVVVEKESFQIKHVRRIP